jgi:hypothetical protein
MKPELMGCDAVIVQIVTNISEEHTCTIFSVCTLLLL